MSYLKTARNRRFKLKINKITSLFRFRFISFDIYSKLIFIGLIISMFSLFIPWAIVNGDILIISYSDIVGNIAYFILLINLLILFFLLSNNLKEIIKLNINIKLKDRYIVLYLSLFSFILSILSLRILSGISNFYEDIVYLKGIVFLIVGNIILLIGSYLENRKIVNESIINVNISDSNSDKNILESEKNMKLPF